MSPDAYVICMLEQGVLVRKRMFGASSYQLLAQSRLFDESETLTQTSTEAQDTAPLELEVPAPTADANALDTKPAHGKRAYAAASLPRMDVVRYAPEVKRTWPAGLHPLP